MSFTVTASTAARAVSFQRGSMLAALEQALMLASSGHDEVRIIDGSGRSHSPAELGRALFDGGPDRRKAARAA